MWVFLKADPETRIYMRAMYLGGDPTTVRGVRPGMEGKEASAGSVREWAAAVGNWTPVLLGTLESVGRTGCRTVSGGWSEEAGILPSLK